MNQDDPGEAVAVHQPATTREIALAEDFVTLADARAGDLGVIDSLQLLAERCVEYLDVSAAGILLIDQRGGLQVAAATSHTAQQLELFELQAQQGPCVDTVAAGTPTVSRDLAAEAERWPRFSARAQAIGIRAVTALPLRLRCEIIGALNLFHEATGGLAQSDERLGQALADAAAIGILTQRAAQDSQQLTEQLQSALNSRIAIEQAKGMLAQYGTVNTDEAFTRLRVYARGHNLRLADLALSILDGNTPLNDVLATTTSGASPEEPSPPLADR